MSTDAPTPPDPAGQGSTNPPDPASAAPAAVDPGGQLAPAPDTVGVSIGQTGTDAAPGDPLVGIPDPSAPAAPTAPPDPSAGAETGGVTGPVGTDAATTTDASSAPATTDQTSPPAVTDDTADLPAWTQNETADPATIRLMELDAAPDRPPEVAPDTSLPADSTAIQQAGDVYVSPTDEALGDAMGRWLEGQAARDSRLSPIVDRLVLLPNIYFKFASDDPVLARPERPAEATPAQTAETTAAAA